MGTWRYFGRVDWTCTALVFSVISRKTGECMASRILSSIPRICGLLELTQTSRFLQGSLDSLFCKSRTSFDVSPISELGLRVNEDCFPNKSLEKDSLLHYHFINKYDIFLIRLCSYLWFFPLFWRIFILRMGILVDVTIKWLWRRYFYDVTSQCFLKTIDDAVDEKGRCTNLKLIIVRIIFHIQYRN